MIGSSISISSASATITVSRPISGESISTSSASATFSGGEEVYYVWRVESEESRTMAVKGGDLNKVVAASTLDRVMRAPDITYTMAAK